MSYGRYDSYNDTSDNRDYSSSPNPFHDSNAAAYGAGEYGAGGYGSPGAHEMSTYGQSNQTNKSPILDECADILNEIRDVGNNRARLTGLQKRCLDDPDSSGESESQRDVDLLTQQIMDQYRRLADRIREVRRNPESRQQLNIPQVGLAERRLKNEVQQFQKQESEFRKESKTQMARQIRIVRPDLTEDEVQDALKDGEGGQVFQDALMRNRLGQANQVLGAVKERHNAMLKIEDDLKNLMNLLEHMHELLAKQEVTVMAIDTNAEQAAGDMVKANEELEVAVTTARKTRKKKWICLGICVTIVVIIVVAVVAYIMVNRAANGGGNNNNTNNNSNNNNSGTTGSGQKRSLFQRDVSDDLQMNTARAVEAAIEEPMARAIAPATRISRRRLNRVRDVTPEDVVKALIEKKFVVDWEGANPTKSG